MGDPWAKIDEIIVQSPCIPLDESKIPSFEDDFCRTKDTLKTFEPLPDSSSYIANLGMLK